MFLQRCWWVLTANIPTFGREDLLIDGTLCDWWCSFLRVNLNPFHLPSLCDYVQCCPKFYSGSRHSVMC